MPKQKIIIVKGVGQKNALSNKSSSNDDQILNIIFPLIVRPMKIMGLWPAYQTPLQRRIFVFLNIFYIHGPMVVYIFKHRDDFLQASYGCCK